MLHVFNFAASNRATLDLDLDSILSGGNDGELSTYLFYWFIISKLGQENQANETCGALINSCRPVYLWQACS